MPGKITRIALREVWKDEPSFTKWLAENIDVLGEAIGLTLAGAEREQAVGDFAVDLRAEDESGRLVVIENQLTKSDHDHLGKLLTYLANLGAVAAVWVVGEPRPEHVQAVSWLNESKSTDFYLVKLEAVRIEDSLPAPLFTRIVGPSEEMRKVGRVKEEETERDKLRWAFWSALLTRAKDETKLHAGISPTRQNWISVGAGMRGLSLNYCIRQDSWRVELWIDRGADAETENLRIFDSLAAKREQIDAAFGGDLSWDRVETRRGQRISYGLPGGLKDPENCWPTMHDLMIDAMIRLEKALRPYIQKLKQSRD